MREKMTPKFLICGLEHTGTTLVSDLFRQVPDLDSGFECGVLLGESPREFISQEPFAGHMLKGWGISRDQLMHCCDTDDFTEFYSRLQNTSSQLGAATQAIFDKTPRYLSQLSLVLERCACPVVVCYKDPRGIVCSDFKRSKTSDFNSWYESYHSKKMGYVRSCYKELMANTQNPRITTVGLEELALNSRATMERMFEGVGETFKLDYALIKELRYIHVRSKVVSADIAFEYRSVLSEEAQARILKDFAEFDAWIYD
jgi:Sulfotransferase family